jgi:opacity protein-like surface antigen
MTKRTRPSVHAAAALAALALATAAGAQVPGPDRIEVVPSADGPRVRIAGIGRGTRFEEAAERLGGAGILNALFGGRGPIYARGELDGLQCSLAVMAGEARGGAADVVEDVMLECEGGRIALWLLARKFRAALAGLPVTEAPGTAWYGRYPLGATVGLVPAKDGAWWQELLGPQVLRVTIR